jgi:hypothetical protein
MHTPLPCDYFMHTVGSFLDFTARENVFMFFFSVVRASEINAGPWERAESASGQQRKAISAFEPSHRPD